MKILDAFQWILLAFTILRLDKIFKLIPRLLLLKLLPFVEGVVIAKEIVLQFRQFSFNGPWVPLRHNIKFFMGWLHLIMYLNQFLIFQINGLKGRRKRYFLQVGRRGRTTEKPLLQYDPFLFSLLHRSIRFQNR